MFQIAKLMNFCHNSVSLTKILKLICKDSYRQTLYGSLQFIQHNLSRNKLCTLECDEVEREMRYMKQDGSVWLMAGQTRKLLQRGDCGLFYENAAGE